MFSPGPGVVGPDSCFNLKPGPGSFSSYVLLCTSGGAILGTQRYLSNQILVVFVRTSGGAILGSQQYSSKQFLVITVFAPSA